MIVPIRYNLRHLVGRWRTNLLTILAIAVVVAVFMVMMSLAVGLTKAFTETGSPDNMLILRSGAAAETSSLITREQTRLVQFLPAIDRDAAGAPVCSYEVLTFASLDRSTSGESNVIIRGVGAKGVALRPAFRLVEGRMFRPGLRELIAGAGVGRRFVKGRVGDRIRLARSTWTIVGVFEDNRSAYESELWGEVEEVMTEFHRSMCSSILLRASSEPAREAITRQIAENPRLSGLNPRQETAYYQEQTKNAAPMKFLGVFLAVVMAVGAVFSAMNTMYAAVSSRGREIATLRVLGFSRRSILISFALESMLLCLTGGFIGCLLSLVMHDYSTGATNFYSFSEVAFAFRITPGLFAAGLVFSVAMGLIGGFLPALQASRRPILDSLRDGQ